MVNAQEWLDKVHPKEKRKNITELDIRDNSLEGELKLEDFDNLKKFCCRGNKLVELSVNDCAELEDLDCSFNSLTNLNFSKLKKLWRFSGSDNILTDLNFLSSFSVDSLIVLNIANNNFPRRDLSILSRFANLELLWIGNDDEEKIEEDIYNRFCGSLKPLKNLTRLESLNISNTDISDGLEEYLSTSLVDKYIYCSSEQRPKSNVKEIAEQVKKLNSSSLVDEDEEKYKLTRLFEEPYKKNTKNKLNSLFKILTNKNKKSYKISNMTEIKKIVLIGRTGQGKSALANVLSGDSKKIKKLEEVKGKWKLVVSSEDEKLKESENSKSETREIQIVEFEYKEETYQIIDSIGIGDTQMTESQVLKEISKGYEIIRDGIHQVLFVNGERFTPEEIETYNTLKELFFDSNVDKYTTIVRTRFPSFEEEDECENDKRLLLVESSAIANMINSCNGVIHVDNPSVNIKGKRGQRDNPRNKEVREESRKILLKHLETWKKEETCKPRSFKEIEKALEKNIKKENERLEEEIKDIKKRMEKMKEGNSLEERQKLAKEIKELENKIKKNEEIIESKKFLASIGCQLL